MKKVIIFLAFLIPFGILAEAQVVDADAQMFGSRRNMSAYSVHDFGEISTSVVSHEFMIKNMSPSEMTIVSFEVTDGFGIIITDKVIKEKSVGKFIVTIDPSLVDKKGDFNEEITITTQQTDALGTTNKNLIYTVKGSL